MANPLATARMRPLTVTVTCPHPAPPSTGRPIGLSQMAGRILDQLSITAWLPAALLMANTYLVAGMYLVRVPGSEPSASNLEQVVAAIDAKAFGVVVAVLFGIVLATLVTQSLEFAAIRFLEGYWGGSIWVAIPTKLGIWIQRRRQYLMARRIEKLDRRAFELSQDDIRDSLNGEDPRFVDAVIEAGLGRPVPPGLTKEQQDHAEGYFDKKHRWRPYSGSNEGGAFPMRAARQASERKSRMFRPCALSEVVTVSIRATNKLPL